MEGKIIQQSMMRQNSGQTRQNVLNKLYNQDIAPEDSQVTSFLYHKTLALQFLVAAFSMCSIVLSLIFYCYQDVLNTKTIEQSYNLMIVFTLLGVLSIILKKAAEIRWIKQKKQKNNSIHYQVLFLLLEVMLYLPTPMKSTHVLFPIVTYCGKSGYMNYNSFIHLYLLFNRFIYVIIFLIHSELYYGSRPDRLSRLYTVNFGTFNTIKFLINEKPGSVIKVTFSFNFFVLPFALYLIEGQVNALLNNFHSCLYFVVVTQATVGYGDITPGTIFGRLVTLVIIMAGVTNTALLLILFMRVMQLKGEEEQSLFLMQSLQTKVHQTRARVFRIQSQWIYTNTRCPPEQKNEKLEQVKAVRYNGRRRAFFDSGGQLNTKRIMLSNFSNILNNILSIQDKTSIIARCLDVIKGPQGSKDTITEKKKKNINNNQNTIISKQNIVKSYASQSKPNNNNKLNTPKSLYYQETTSNRKVTKRRESFTDLITSLGQKDQAYQNSAIQLKRKKDDYQDFMSFELK